MKKIILIILIASFIGGSMAYVFYKNIDKDITIIAKKDDNVVTAFQVGVFQNYENALTEKNKYKTAIIVNDKDQYRVYIALVSSRNLKDKYQLFFQDLNISYFCKEISVSDNFKKYLLKYEKLISSSEDTKIYNNAINDILSKYQEEIS